MAVFTHTLGITYHTDAGTIASTTDVYTGDSENDFTGTFNASSLNSEVDIAVTVASVKSLVLYAAQDMTIKTNSATTPANTINLKAKKQLVWNTDMAVVNPFTTNITKIFASCTNTTILEMRFLEHQAVP